MPHFDHFIFLFLHGETEGLPFSGEVVKRARKSYVSGTSRSWPKNSKNNLLFPTLGVLSRGRVPFLARNNENADATSSFPKSLPILNIISRSSFRVWFKERWRDILDTCPKCFSSRSSIAGPIARRELDGNNEGAESTKTSPAILGWAGLNFHFCLLNSGGQTHTPVCQLHAYLRVLPVNFFYSLDNSLTEVAFQRNFLMSRGPRKGGFRRHPSILVTSLSKGQNPGMNYEKSHRFATFPPLTFSSVVQQKKVKFLCRPSSCETLSLPFSKNGLKK